MSVTPSPPPAQTRVLDDRGLIALPWLMYLNNVANLAQSGVAGSFLSVLNFGAKADLQTVLDGVMTAGSGILASASALFMPNHVGKACLVSGAGVGGSVLSSVISAYSSASSVTLADAASVSVAAAIVDWGTDNSIAFQAAVDFPSDIGSRLIPPGSYLGSIDLTQSVSLYLQQALVLSAAAHTVKMSFSGASLLGDGYQSRIINRASASGNPTGNVVLVMPGLSKLLIDSLSIEPPVKAYFDQPVDEAAYNLGNAVYVGGDPASRVSGISIRNCHIGSGNNGVVFDNVDRSEVSGCLFENDSIGLCQVGLFGANYCTVSGNRFVDSAGYANAIYVRRSSYGALTMLQLGNVISGNAISGTYTFEAINVVNASYTSVSGNSIDITVTANNSSGIVFQAGSAVTVQCRENTISGNSIVLAVPGGVSAGVAGIGIHSTGTATMIGTVVSANSVAAPGIGVSVVGALRTVITGNQIRQVAGSASGTCITTTAASIGTQILGNTISDATTHGIYAGGSKERVSANHIKSCGSNGIFVGGGQNSDYSSNLLESNVNYGIGFTTASTNIICRGNQYVANGDGTIAGLTEANTGTHEIVPMRYSQPVGIGTYPAHKLHVKGKTAGGDPILQLEDDSYSELRIRIAAAGGSGSDFVSIFSGQASAGVLATPLVIANGAELVRTEGRGYDGSAMQIAGMAGFWVDGAPGSGDVPGRWDLFLKTAAGSFTRKLRVSNDGRITFGSSGTDPILFYGSGSPEGVVTALVGSIYLRTGGGAGTAFYVKESGTGNTGWTAIVTSTTPTVFTDRGDASAPDHTQATLTIDSAWHDWDLSGIVPAGATSVLIRALVSNATAASAIWLRKNGQSNTVNSATLRATAPAQTVVADLVVACDANRVIEYYVGNLGTYDDIDLTVAGWWK